MIKVLNGIQCLCDDDTGEVLIRPFWKTPYNHDTDEVSKATAIHYPEEVTRTDQSFKDESNINTIMNRIRLGMNEIPPVLPEHFGDATAIPDGTEMRRIVAENNATFYLLDPAIRARFQNDPGMWVETVREHLGMGNVDAVEALGIDMQQYRDRVASDEAAALAAAEKAEAAAAKLAAKKTDTKQT